jgi:imidazolonepropionase-like amidohydrolase
MKKRDWQRCWILCVAIVWPVRAATLLLTHGTLHTATGPALTNASLFVRDGRIEAVAPATPPAADSTIDLGGDHVFPGLIGLGTVLGLQEIDAVRATLDVADVGEFTPDVRAWIAVNPDSELIPVARANGITHAQAVPGGGVVSGISGVIQLTGWTIEQMAVLTNAALHVRWPAFTLDTTPKERSPAPDTWKSLEDQTRDRDKKLRELDTFFSEAEAYARAKAAATDPTRFTPVPAWEAMLPFLRRERPLWIHADEVRQIRSAIEWVARHKYTAVLAGGRDAWRLPELLATNRIAVAFAHVFTLPVREIDPYDAHFAAPALLARAGVRVAMADSIDGFGASNLRNLPYAAAQARAFGLPDTEALQSVTLRPAEMLGLQDRLGSLTPGKDATFFTASGDILDVRARVKRMWIEGREVGLESRHTRLYERYRQRPAPPR